MIHTTSHPEISVPGEQTTTTPTTPDETAAPTSLMSIDHDDTNTTKTEYDSAIEEKKQPQTTEDARVDDENAFTGGSTDSQVPAATSGDQNDAGDKSQGDSDIVYFHGLRFNLIAIWYVEPHDVPYRRNCSCCYLCFYPPSPQIGAKFSGIRFRPPVRAPQTSHEIWRCDDPRPVIQVAAWD